MCYNIWVDIVIPLLSAFIGGFVTMWGVILTIKSEKKKDKENDIKAVKPWIYSINALERYDPKNANEVIISNDFDFKNSPHYSRKHQMIIKNTDNGIGIIEEVQTKKKSYFPICGSVLEKSSVFEIYLCIDEDDNLDDAVLIISDIYDNRYLYKIDYHATMQGPYDDEIKMYLIKEINTTNKKLKGQNKKCQ